jgi:hypothetical protein
MTLAFLNTNSKIIIMNVFLLNKTNRASLFFAMALLPSGLMYSQSKKDTITKEKKIEEVVVIGYGTQRKESVTGSVASVKGDILREVPSANITQALQGRTAGVDISQSSTKPGAAMQIRIRGTRSLSGDNNPLVVLDGIPFAGSLSDISSSDIKSIDNFSNFKQRNKRSKTSFFLQYFYRSSDLVFQIPNDGRAKVCQASCRCGNLYKRGR